MKPGLATSIGLAVALALVAAGVFAQSAPVANSRVIPSLAQNSTDAGLDERLARDWGLRPEEWARYRQLMQGPLGIYSPNLDPLTALGIEARSDEERNRYAELQVQAESRRVGKMLAYQRAYDAAWQRVFPGQQRVNLPGAKRVPVQATRAPGGWLSSSRPTARCANSACASCRQLARPSISTWSAAARTMPASASGRRRPASTPHGCGRARSRSIMMAAAGCP